MAFNLSESGTLVSVQGSGKEGCAGIAERKSGCERDFQ
jgi:hypothetical protein